MNPTKSFAEIAKAGEAKNTQKVPPTKSISPAEPSFQVVSQLEKEPMISGSTPVTIFSNSSIKNESDSQRSKGSFKSAEEPNQPKPFNYESNAESFHYSKSSSHPIHPSAPSESPSPFIDSSKTLPDSLVKTSKPAEHIKLNYNKHSEPYIPPFPTPFQSDYYHIPPIPTFNQMPPMPLPSSQSYYPPNQFRQPQPQYPYGAPPFYAPNQPQYAQTSPLPPPKKGKTILSILNPNTRENVISHQAKESTDISNQEPAAKPVSETPIVPTIQKPNNFIVPESVRQTPKIVLKDKNGNIIDLASKFKKPTPASAPPSQPPVQVHAIEPVTDIKPVESKPSTTIVKPIVEGVKKLEISFKPAPVQTQAPPAPIEVALEEGEIIEEEEEIPQPIPTSNGFRYPTLYLLKLKDMCLDWPTNGDSPLHDIMIGSTSSPLDVRGHASKYEKSKSGSGSRGKNTSVKSNREFNRNSDRGDRGDRDRDRNSRYEKKPSIFKQNENMWLPKALQKPSNAPVDKHHELARAMISILNKLTPERFDTLTQQIIDLDIPNEDLLLTVINQIFDKAINEAHYGKMYAILCTKLNDALYLKHDWMHTDKSAPYNPSNSMFRRKLVYKCQIEFEKGSKWAEEDQKSRALLKSTKNAEERDRLLLEREARIKEKIRSLGNVRFIGELFKLNIISAQIMHRCMCLLLAEEPDEEQTESMCKLLTTVGEQLQNSEKVDFKGQMNLYFEKIEELSDNMSLTSRLRFMLKDLIDLRAAGWKSNKSSGPKLLAQIRKETMEKPVVVVSRPKLILTHNERKPESSSAWKTGNAKANVITSMKDKAETITPQKNNMFSALSDEKSGDEDSNQDNAQESETIQIAEEEKLKNKISGMVKEWESIYDRDEVIARIIENPSRSALHDEKVIKEFLVMAMEKKQEHVIKTSILFSHLAQDKIIDIQTFIKVFGEYNEEIEEYVSDIPFVYKFMGIFIAHLISYKGIQTRVIELKDVGKLFGGLVENTKVALKLVEKIQAYIKELPDSLIEFDVAKWNLFSL